MSKNINKRKLTFLLMCLYMFEQKSECMNKDDNFTNRNLATKTEDNGDYFSLSQSDNSKSIRSFKGLLVLSALIIFISSFTNYFTDNVGYTSQTIVADNTTTNCNSFPYIYNGNLTTNNCPSQLFECTTDSSQMTSTCSSAPISCNTDESVMTSNCGSESNVCTTDPLIITQSCPTCDTTGILNTTNCDSNFNYVCNNRTDIPTTNCGTLTPVTCNAAPFAQTTNCSNTATCTNDLSKYTSNCNSLPWIANPNQNTIFCSNVTLSPNICNIDPLASSLNCPNAPVIIDANACVKNAAGTACLTSNDGSCGNTPTTETVPLSQTQFGSCPSYTSVAKNVPLASGHACTTTIGATNNAVTCGDCYETATEYQKADNNFAECSGFNDLTPVYMQYDISKANVNLISTCNTVSGTSAVTCGGCYSGATQAEQTNNVFPECGITPYDPLKAANEITAGTCTTSVSGANTATTCGACYNSASISQQTFRVLPNCGITPYSEAVKNGVVITVGTCTTSITGAATAANCGDCYNTASSLEKINDVLADCGMSPSIINIANANKILVPLYANPAIVPLDIPCGSCPVYSFSNSTSTIRDYDNCEEENADIPTCTSYDGTRNSNLLFGDCPFNSYASTCASCYLQPNVTDYQRDVNVIPKCSKVGDSSWSYQCVWCNEYKYTNASSIWDPACTTNIIPCANCNNWLNKPECTTRQEMSCSQCGSCNSSPNNITNTPPECIVKQSIPCTTCTDPISQSNQRDSSFTGSVIDLFSKQCAYKPSIPCSSCDACSGSVAGNTVNIPKECRQSPTASCSSCTSCVSTPLTAASECQLNTTVNCNTCCGSGLSSYTPSECKIKTSVPCTSCATCTSGANIPSECVVNKTVQCINCNGCTSGSFIPDECAVIPTVSCSACSSCSDGTNIPSECAVVPTVSCTSCNACVTGANIPLECQVPATVLCGDCVEGTSLTECTGPQTVKCHECPEWETLTECQNHDGKISFDTQDTGGFVLNILLGLFGGVNAFTIAGLTLQTKSLVKYLFSGGSVAIGTLILIGINADISVLGSLAGNSLMTVSGEILGTTNIVAGVLNMIMMALVPKNK